MSSIHNIVLLLVFASLAHCASFAQRSRSPSSNKRGVWSGPVNEVAMAGQAAILNMDCSTEADLPTGSTRIQWWEYGTKGDGNLITDSTQLLLAHPKYPRYTLAANTTTGLHRLAFKANTIDVSDGTLYKCIDFYASTSSPDQSRGAQLVVIKENPTIVTTLVRPVVLEGDYHSVEAQIEFGASYPIAPLLTWTGPTPFGRYSTVTNRTVWSGINFNVNRSMDNQSFHLKVNFTSSGFGGPGMADNVPLWEYEYDSTTMIVMWRPKNLFIEPAEPPYQVGMTVTCFADANPIADFTWQAVDGPLSGTIWQAPYFEITESMIGVNTMRCNARNTIEGVVYTNDLFVVMQVNDPSMVVTSTESTTESTPQPVESSLPPVPSYSPTSAV